MPPKRRRRFHGLYYHSSPPKVMPMNGQMSQQNGRKRRDVDDCSVKLSTIRIWMHEKDTGKLTRILWAGQGHRLSQQASTNPKVKRFLAAVPYVMNFIKEVHQSVIDNNLETLQAKLEPPVAPALITCKDANGLNVIHKAAGLGHTMMLEYLVGVWPDGTHETDVTGKTPLHWAASAKNNMRCYTLLTQAGCDEEALDYKMKTPSYYRHKPHEIERAFLVYVPEAPRVSPGIATDWEALCDDSSDGKKLDIKIPEMNGNHSSARTIDDSADNTSDADLIDGLSVNGELEEEMLKDNEEAVVENGNATVPATPDMSENEPNEEATHEEDATQEEEASHEEDVSHEEYAHEEAVENGHEAVQEVSAETETETEVDADVAAETDIAAEVEAKSADENAESEEENNSKALNEMESVEKKESMENGTVEHEEPEEEEEAEESEENVNKEEIIDANIHSEIKEQEQVEDEPTEQKEQQEKEQGQQQTEKQENEQELTQEKEQRQKQDEKQENGKEQEKEQVKRDAMVENNLGNVQEKETAENQDNKDDSDEDAVNNKRQINIAESDEENETEVDDKEMKPQEDENLEAVNGKNTEDNYEPTVIENEKNNNEKRKAEGKDNKEANEAETLEPNKMEQTQNKHNENETDKTEEILLNKDSNETSDNIDKREMEDQAAEEESGNYNENNAVNKKTKTLVQDQETGEATCLQKKESYKAEKEGADFDDIEGEQEENQRNVDDESKHGMKREAERTNDNNNGIIMENQTDEVKEAIQVATPKPRSARVKRGVTADSNGDEAEEDDDEDVVVPTSLTRHSGTGRRMLQHQTETTESIDENHNEERYPPTESPTSSLAIEGFVQGDSEDNTVQSQSAAYIDEEARLQHIIASGDMEQLAQIVLNGDGGKLVNMQSSEAEIQAFLNNVPNYMGKIRRVHEAARDGSLLSLQQALDRRKFAIAKDEISPNGATPLHVAVLFGHTDIVRYLAARFPETAAVTDNQERTALHYAATIKDNGHFYNLLTQLGANSQALDKLGHTPEFYLDAEQSKDVLSYRQLLSDFGAEELEEELLSDQGHIEGDSYLSNPIFKTEQGKYLASTLADPLIKALTEIAHKRPADPVSFLASFLHSYVRMHNPEISFPQPSSSKTASTAVINSRTPAMRKSHINSNLDAAPHDDIEEDRLYKDEGGEEGTTPQLEDRDEHGQSMLHFACARSHRRGGLTHLIEESNIDITYRDELYRTARDVSLQANQPANAKEIDRYVLSQAVVGDLRPFEHFAEMGYDHIVDVVDDSGKSVIDIAAERGHEQLADYMRNLRSLEETREELHQMIRDNNMLRIKEITAAANGKWLLKAKNYYGRTALHIALLKESEEIVQYLLNLNPEILRIGDNLERTALHYAMGANAIERLSRILIQNGAKRTSKDLKGRQPSYYFMNKADILRLQEEEEENR